MSIEDDWFNEETATLGDRIAAAREAAGIAPAELALRLGVTAAAIDRWENDRSEPRPDRLQMLSGMLGVSLGWLMTGAGEGVEAPMGEAAAETPPPDGPAAGELAVLRRQLIAIAERIGALEQGAARNG